MRTYVLILFVVAMAPKETHSFLVLAPNHNKFHLKRTAPSFVCRMASSSPSSSSSSSSSAARINNKDNGQEASLQVLFESQCDQDGLMTKQRLQQIPIIQELLQEEDLLPQELNDIWNAAPKVTTNDDDQRINVDSFIQIYRDIDDLFEENLVEEEEELELIQEAIHEAEEQEDDDDVEIEQEDEQELQRTFKTLCDSNNNGLLSKEQLMKWDEIQKLQKDGLLGDDELDEIWRKIPKSSAGSPNQQLLLNVDGFLSFNAALDDLFVFDDVDEQDDDDDETKSAKSPPQQSPARKEMVQGNDLPPAILFAALANDDDCLVGRPELDRWSELQEMLADESILPLEFENIYDGIPKAAGEKLDEAGFTALWEAIDSLFEDDDDNDDEDEEQAGESQATDKPKNDQKTQLMALLAEMNSDPDRLSCGLESSPQEENLVMEIVNELEKTPSNMVQQKQGDVQLSDMAGSWELLYSSSSAMKFNKGLSGLGGSVPNGKFAGLVQNLYASKYMSDVEYIERIEMIPSSASFDVRVTGDWDLRKSVSLFTGSPSTVMTVEPARVMYGPTSTKADHWKSLGPMNMLDVTYLDHDLRIMRGNTATDNIFVFRRV